MPKEVPQHIQKFFKPAAGPEQRRAVGSVRNRAVDDAANAHFAENRHALDGALEPRRDAIQVVREQLVGGVPLRESARRPGLVQARAFVDAHQAGFLLLPEIAGGVGVAHHRNLAAALHERGNRMRHHVVMLHVGDGRIGADHRRDLAGIAARGIHHHLGDDAALAR